MKSDHTILVNKIRRLSTALIVSGALNIAVLSLLYFHVVQERPPTPYCELKPANDGTPLTDYRGSAEIITQLHKLPFQQLLNKLNDTQLVENGYTERDLALACLVSFYHFNIERALPSVNSSGQKRIFTWKNRATGENEVLTLFSGITTSQFNQILQFAKTEQWPLTTEGLFLALQKQNGEQNIDPSLMETFMLTPDFWTVERLFNRFSPTIRKQKIMELLLEGNWTLFKNFVDQQRQLQDLSDARRQKFLLDYIKVRSESAAELILQTDYDFAVKKMDDPQVVALLQILPKKVDNERYAKEMLTSPRSLSVWQQASLRLYEYAGESIPTDWNYQSSVARFTPDEVGHAPSSVEDKGVSKPVVQVQELVKPSPPRIVAKPEIKPTAKPEVRVIANKQAPMKPPAVKPKTPPYRLYIVQEGDSLWKISRRFGVDVEVLKERNQIQSTAIKPGTVLKIP